MSHIPRQSSHTAFRDDFFSCELENKAKELVVDYYSENEIMVGGYRVLMDADNVYTVWLCKTLQNFKGLFSTPAEDGLCFEVTYNGDKDEMYVDTYQKIEKTEALKSVNGQRQLLPVITRMLQRNENCTGECIKMSLADTTSSVETILSHPPQEVKIKPDIDV